MLLRQAFVFGLLVLTGFASGTTVIWAGTAGGPHSVGVTHIAGSGLEVTSWYPATAGGRAARLRDYSNQMPGLVTALVGAGISSKVANAFADSVVAARWDAPREKGNWPLVLIAQGNRQDAFDQAVLAEIIASHGFVVATVPSATIKTPMKSADDVGPIAQQQAEDLLAVTAALASRGDIDTSRIAIVGHSFGARAALLMAMHDSRVKALVSLDGGIGTSTAQESFAAARWFSRERGTAPVLHFYETVDKEMTPDFTLLRSLPARDLSLREVQGFHHSHFTTIGFEAAVEPSIAKLTRLDSQGPAVLRTMVADVVQFLSANLGAPVAEQGPAENAGKTRAEWAALRESNFTVPPGQTPIALLRQMNPLLGSTDPFLRDNVAYEAATKWIFAAGLLSADEQREMLTLWTRNLQAGLGEAAGDGAFRRSFSALNLSIIAARENASPFLSQAEFDSFLTAMLDYLGRERDTRGYDTSKGWVHAAAHTADVLKFLTRSSKLPAAAQPRVLAAIDGKCRTFGSVFQWGEDARLAQVIVSLAKRPDFDKSAFDLWLAAVRARRNDVWKQAPAVDPVEFVKLQNVILVLRAAYVSLSIEPIVESVQPVRAALIQTLSALR